MHGLFAYGSSLVKKTDLSPPNPKSAVDTPKHVLTTWFKTDTVFIKYDTMMSLTLCKTADCNNRLKQNNTCGKPFKEEKNAVLS